MNNVTLPIDPTQILLAAVQQAASMAWGVLTTLPWWAQLLLGLLLVFRLVRPTLESSPTGRTLHRGLRRRRW